MAIKAVPTIDEHNYTDEELAFISAVVEAESDRSIPSEDEVTTEGRIFIAVTIINRVDSSYFPNTVNQVLCQANQFSTVRNGCSVCSATTYSDEAVRIAIERIENGEVPRNILFFNCVGFNNGQPFYNPEDGSSTIGGNYFMTYGG